MNGHSLGSDAEGLKGDLREFLGGEIPLHQLDDLTKVNPVTLETGMGLPRAGIRLVTEASGLTEI